MKYLSIRGISREDVICNHMRPLAKETLADSGDKAILMLDNTYIYLQ